MVDIEEDHTVVLDLMAEAALLLQLLPLLTAEFAPMVDEAIVPPADILFEPAMLPAVHPAVGVSGVSEEPVDYVENSGMPRWVVFLDFFHFCSKCRDGQINELHYGSPLTRVFRKLFMQVTNPINVFSSIPLSRGISSAPLRHPSPGTKLLYFFMILFQFWIMQLKQ